MNKYMKFIILIIQGMVVGTGAILPGVSGGVLCIAFGIYEPMMRLFSSPIKAFKEYKKIFIPFIIGWVLGFVLIAGFVDWIFSLYPTYSLLLFSGLISGAIPELMKKSEEAKDASWSPYVNALFITYILFMLMNSKLSVSIEPNALWYIFCGAIWGLSIVIPGLSSSSLLILLGLYEPMTKAIAGLDIMTILCLLLGLGISIALSARLVNVLLKKHYSIFSRTITGIMAASTLMIIPKSFEGVADVLLSLILFVAGFLIARYMDKSKAKVEENI